MPSVKSSRRAPAGSPESGSWRARRARRARGSAQLSLRPSPASVRSSTRSRSTTRPGGGDAGSSMGRERRFVRPTSPRRRSTPRFQRAPPRRSSARRWWSCGSRRRTSSCRRDRGDWAPNGIVAYSKICTHAGCAVALYRKPLFPPAEPEPALVCPCHYSTFNPATGGTVLFGPAGRDLPQLPLEIDHEGFLRAGGNFSGPVGPSFWGVRTRGPHTT